MIYIRRPKNDKTNGTPYAIARKKQIEVKNGDLFYIDKRMNVVFMYKKLPNPNENEHLPDIMQWCPVFDHIQVNKPTLTIMFLGTHETHVGKLYRCLVQTVKHGNVDAYIPEKEFFNCIKMKKPGEEVKST